MTIFFLYEWSSALVRESKLHLKHSSHTSLFIPSSPAGFSALLLEQVVLAVLIPLDRRLFWMANRSSSLTSGLKWVKSSRVSEPGGDRHGTRADALISEGPRPRPGCWSIILNPETSTQHWGTHLSLINDDTMIYNDYKSSNVSSSVVKWASVWQTKLTLWLTRKEKKLYCHWN